MQSLAPDNIRFEDLAVNEEKEESEILHDEEDRDAEDCDASAGTFARVPGVFAHPDPFAFAAPPPLVSTTVAPTPVVYKDITSPFNKPWDLSLKADQA